MQKYKFTIGIVVLFLVFIIAGYIIIQKKQTVTISSSIEAVPINASLIIKIQDIDRLITQLDKHTAFWSHIKDINIFDNLNSQIKLITEKRDEIKQLSYFVKNKSILISVHLQGKEKIEYLYVIENLSNSEKKKAVSLIQELTNDTSTFTKKEYDNETISQISVKDKNKEHNILYFSFIDGNFIFSFSELLIENSIKQIHSHNPINLDITFNEISETVGNNSLANIYVNYTQISKIINPMASNDFKLKLKNIENISNWSSLDMNFLNNNVIFSGFTNNPTSPDKYLSIFRNQTPQKNTIIEILPIYIIDYMFFGISDSKLFHENYSLYLSNKDLLDTRKKYFDDLNEKYDIKLDQVLVDIFENELLICNLRFNFLVADQSKFIILKTNSSAEKKLFEVIEKYCKVNNSETKSYTKEVELLNSEKLDLYKFPFENILTNWLGELYNFPDHKYYCFIANNIIFSNDYEKLKSFVNEYNAKNLLSTTDNYVNFNKIISEKSNLLYYSNTNLSIDDYTSYLNESLSKTFKTNVDKFRKIYALGLQISFLDDLFYTNLCLNYSPKKTNESYVIWGTELEANIAIKPKLVINHNNNEKEVFVQDTKNNIYLISNDGKILWKNKITEKIISEIYQIDYLKNGKLQIMFNTKNYIFLVDRNGESVGSFPVKLKSAATNGLTIVDYDNTKSYRIFIACENKKVLLLNKEGTLITDWSFETTEEKVTMPIQFLTNDSKDYIIFSDKLNVYILNRKGEKRIQLTNNFPKSENNKFFLFPKTEKIDAHFVTTNSSGTVVNIYLDGTTKELTLKEFSHSHYFQCIDLNGDNLEDYIFVDEKYLYIYDNSGNEIESYKFENDISLPIDVYKFSTDDLKIGVVDSIGSKVYLFNKNGSIYQDFPINGNFSFSIGILKGNKFSLLTGNQKKIIHNYQIE